MRRGGRGEGGGEEGQRGWKLRGGRSTREVDEGRFGCRVPEREISGSCVR